MKKLNIIALAVLLMVGLFAGSAVAQTLPPQANYSGFVQSTVAGGNVTLSLVNGKITSVQYADSTTANANTAGSETIINIVNNVLLNSASILQTACDETTPAGQPSVTFDPSGTTEITNPSPLFNYLTADLPVTFYKIGSTWSLHPPGVILDPNDPLTLNLTIHNPTNTGPGNESRFITELEASLAADRKAGMTMVLTPFPGASLCGGGIFNALGIIEGAIAPNCGVSVDKTVTPDNISCTCNKQDDSDSDSDDSDDDTDSGSDSNNDGDTDSGDGDHDSDSDSSITGGGDCQCSGLILTDADSDSDSSATDGGDSGSDSNNDGDTDSGDGDYDSDSDTDVNGGTPICPANQIVTYTYVITNNGGAMTDVSVVDNKLGTLAEYPTFDAGATVTITKEACIFETIENQVDVVGSLVSDGTICEAEDTATVTVSYEPEPPAPCTEDSADSGDSGSDDDTADSDSDGICNSDSADSNVSHSDSDSHGDSDKWSKWRKKRKWRYDKHKNRHMHYKTQNWRR